MSDQAFSEAVERVGELMDTWQGALSSLYAATDPEAIGGALYGPDKDGGYRGYPAQAIIKEHAMDLQLAAQLWKFAEEETGIYYP